MSRAGCPLDVATRKDSSLHSDRQERKARGRHGKALCDSLCASVAVWECQEDIKRDSQGNREPDFTHKL